MVRERGFPTRRETRQTLRAFGAQIAASPRPVNPFRDPFPVRRQHRTVVRARTKIPCYSLFSSMPSGTESRKGPWLLGFLYAAAPSLFSIP
jgi:hypothetical protein